MRHALCLWRVKFSFFKKSKNMSSQKYCKQNMSRSKLVKHSTSAEASSLTVQLCSVKLLDAVLLATTKTQRLPTVG